MTHPAAGVGTDGPPPGPPSPRSGWRRPFGLVGAVLKQVYVEPVVEGRIRVIDWPRGLPLLGLIATVGYLVAMLLAAASPYLRRVLDLQLLLGLEPVGITPDLAWIVVALIMVAAALLQTGALHSPWWLRVSMLLISFTLMTIAGTFPTRLSDLAVMLGSGLVLVVFQLIRWRSEFRWWEFVVVVACYAGPLTIAARNLSRTRAIGGAGPADWTMLTLPTIGLIAAPVALMAGYAIAQWAFATVVWGVDLGRRQLPSWVLVLVAAALLGWRIVADWALLLGRIFRLASIVVPGLLVVGTVVVWLLLDKIADRRGPSSTRLADLSDDLRSVALPIAILITGSGLISTILGTPLSMIGTLVDVSLASAVVGVVGDFVAGAPFSVLAAVVLLIISVVLARRSDRGRAELVAVLALSFPAMRIFGATGATDLMGVWVSTPLALIFGGLAVTRRLTRTRLEGVLVAAGLVAVLQARPFFADPIDFILGGSAALVLSLVWQFLTSGADANTGSRRFPRPNRVLLLLGNSLLGMAVLAYNRMTLDTIALLETMQKLGDRILGGALILGSIVAVVTSVLRNEDLAGAPAEVPSAAQRAGSQPGRPTAAAPPIAPRA